MSLSPTIRAPLVTGLRGPGLTGADKATLDAATGAANRAQTTTQALAASAQATDLVNRLSPWTPASLNLVGWWDASDLTSITFVNGEVDQIADKSGMGLTLSAIGATKRPGFVADGAAPALYFPGDGRALSTAAITIRQPMTVFAVYLDQGSGGPQQSIFDAGGKILLRARQGGGPIFFAGTSLRLMSGLTGGGFHVYSGSAAAGTGKISADGNAASVGPVGANDAVAAPIYIGDSPIADAPLAGLLGEVIIVPYDLAPEDDMHKRIVGYLAAKWGVQERLAAVHPYRYTAPVTGRTPVPAQLINRGPAMIPRGPSGSWYEANIFDPRPMVDPFDATKLMMYTTGQAAPVGSGTASIGLWRASKADFVAWTINKSLPNPWTFDRIVLQKAAAGQWDGKAGGVRLGSVVYRAGVFYLYYASQLDLTEIGLATSPDGVTFTRLASNPILSPAAQDRVDGTDVGDPFVIYDDGRWTMVYSYRTASDVLPGYRYAISTDGKAWVKSGDGDILSRPRRGLQTESHQVLRRGGRYYMVFEMGGSPADKTPYRNFLAAAERLQGPYTIKKLLVAERGAGAATTDTLHVATPFLFALDGQDYLFWQGAGDLAQPYYNNRWDLFATQIANALS